MNLLNLLKDVIWMMGVTITNLGYGDFTPRNNSALIPLSNFECRIEFFSNFQGKGKNYVTVFGYLVLLLPFYHCLVYFKLPLLLVC